MKKPTLSELTLREKIGQMLLPHQYHLYINKKGSVMDFLNANEDPQYLKNDEEVKAHIQRENFGVLYFEQVEMHKLQNIDMTDTSPVRGPTCTPSSLPLSNTLSIGLSILKNAASCHPQVLPAF